MVNSKIIKRLLAGVLCTSLIFQSVSIGVDARESRNKNDIEVIDFEQISDTDDTTESSDSNKEQIESTESEASSEIYSDIYSETEAATDDDKNVSEAEEETKTETETEIRIETETETEISSTEEQTEEVSFDEATTTTMIETEEETETQSLTEESIAEEALELSDDSGDDTEETYSVFVEACDKYDNMGEYLHLKVTGDVKSIEFADEGFEYVAIDDKNNKFSLKFESCVSIDDYKILKLKKDEWTDNKLKEYSIEISQEIEEESSTEDTDSKSVSALGAAASTTKKKKIAVNNKLEIFSGLLYVGYNSANGKIDYQFTSDISGSIGLSVVNADETEDYSVDNSTYEIKSADGKVKLNENTDYYLKFNLAGEEKKVKITKGSYKDKIRCNYKPEKIILYEPYDAKPVYTYIVESDEKLIYENGVSYYCFSEKMINSSQISARDKVFDIHVIFSNSNATIYENVTLKESKWDGTYDFEVLHSSMIDSAKTNLTLYLGNTNYDNAKLVIKNAKAVPEITGYNQAIIKFGEVEKVNEKNEYTVTVNALSLGTTYFTIKVGDEVANINVSVINKKVIEKLYFYDDPSVKTKDFKIEGIDKKIAIDIAIDPELAAGSGDVIQVVPKDKSIVDFFSIEDIEEENTNNDKVWIHKRIILQSKSLGNTIVEIKVNNLILTCNVNVAYAVFSESEKMALKKSVGTLYAITNVDGDSLYNVELPKGWEWIDSKPYIEIDENKTIKYYEARYTQDGYAPYETLLPVAITEVIGVTISGDNELTTAHQGKYKISFKLRGYNVDFKENKSFENAMKNVAKCVWKADSMLKVKGAADEWDIAVEAGDTASVSEGLLKVSVTVGEDTFSDDFPILILTEHINSIVIKPTASMIRPIKYTYDESENIIFIQEDRLTPSTNMLHFNAVAKIDKIERPMSKGVINWTINDEKVATINEEEDGSVSLKLLSAGTVILTAEANDVGKYSVSIPIEIRDFTPIMETKTLKINKYFEEGLELPIHAVEGNPITSIYFDDKSIFKVETVNGKFIMKIINPEKITETTTLKSNINVRTRMSDNLFTDVEIIVDVTKPNINLKLISPANVFYTNAKAKYLVDSNFEIESITNTKTRTKGFVVEDYDRVNKIVTFGASGLSASNVDEFRNTNMDVCNVGITVKCKGYGQYTDVVKMKPEYKKPKLKIMDINTVVTKMTNDTFIYEGSKDKVIELANVNIQSMTDKINISKSANKITVYYDGSKSLSYKLFLSSDSWTSTVIANGKISIVGNMQTELGVSEISLNLIHNESANGAVKIPVSVKKNTSDIVSARIVGSDSKSKAIVENRYLNIRYNSTEKCIETGLNSTALANVKAGSYKYKIYGNLASGLELKPVTLKINIIAANKKPAISLTGKGSINLINRQGTAIVYTPTIKNMTTSIKSINLAGLYSNYFTAVLINDNNGKQTISVTANPDIPMNTSTKYPLEIKCMCENNVETTTIVNIKPKNTVPKLKQSSKKCVIHKIADNSATWNVNTTSYGKIKDLVVVESKASKYFTFTNDGNNMTVKLNPEYKRIVPKKNYTISYSVIFKDAATNVKPTTLKMTISVK